MSNRKIEFWVVTAVILYIILHFVQDAAHVLGQDSRYDIVHHLGKRFFEKNLLFDYLKHRTYPMLTYCLTVYVTFVVFNFYIYPKLYLPKDYTLTVLLSLLVYMAIVIAFSVTDTWFFGYMQVNFWYFFVKNLVLGVLLLSSFVLYIALREAIGEYYRRNEGNVQAAIPRIQREMKILGGIWLGILLLLILSLGSNSGDASSFWFTMVPYAYFLYALDRYILLPEYDREEKQFWPYLAKLLSYSLLLSLPFMLVYCVLKGFDPEVVILMWLVQLVVVGSFSALVYDSNRKRTNQLVTLKKALGQSNANLGFLRSQINPHFLFNTLNTLYGTALQENSERTAQGIQMLGDMMRFMLHENHQHKILLSREMEYMRNYIALQSLRTSSSPDIAIQTRIEDVLEEKFISPMLLIPFVENAFKHGISLKHRSWIKVTLYYAQGRLFFDVYNSIHARQEQDLEKDKSGIGLENVKQRLTLLYPNRHELVIRETSEEFFVHLTLEL